MNKIVFLTIIAMIAGAGSLQAQKKGGKTQPKAQTKVQTKVQPATERKPKTAEIDSLIRCYLFGEAEDLISSELEGQPSADYAAKLRARKAQAEKGSTMLEATQKVVVVDSQVVSREAIAKTFALHESCGRLLSAKEVKDLLGTGVQPMGLAFINDFGDHMIFSHTASGKGAKLMQTSLFGDKWSSPTPLDGIGDSLSTEGYPFMMADGTTLYFAAKDEGGLGGYDIYVTRYDADSGRYLKAENVGMPFCSPANDYLMAYDEVNNLGWFVSDRHQPADKVCVYTFIPEDSRETYDDMAEEQLLRMAALHSIADTQKESKAATDEALKRLAEARSAHTATAGNDEFCFDVGYGKRYLSLSEFKNTRAKEKAGEWAKKQLRRSQLADLLKESRNKYAAAKSDAERKALAPVILRQEQELEAQDLQLSALANEVRSLENGK